MFARLLCALSLLGAGLAARADTPALGRLFFTPEKRAALDRQRELNLTQTREANSEGSSLTINGVVRRSSGRSTTWVNGTPINENLVLPGTAINPSKNAPAKVEIGEHQLKIGDSLNQGTGEKDDLLRGGSITVTPGSSTKPARK